MSEILFQCKINGRAKSQKNSKQIFRGRNGKPFITSSNQFKKWATYASIFLSKAKSRETIDFPCALEIKAFYKNRKNLQDADNVISGVADMIQKCEIVKNDNLFYRVSCEKIYDNNQDERIEVTITELQCQQKLT